MKAKTKKDVASTWTTNCADIKNHQNYAGFVYLITCRTTKKKYIGCKQFWTNKGKETNWKTYVSSSSKLKGKDINNPKLYKKDIIYLAKTIIEMKAYEAYLQLQAYWNGRWDEYFNEYICFRLRRRKTKE